MNNKENLIKEQRTIEAMKKGYMGYEGKFAFIAKKMGDPIISQHSGNFEQTFMEDFYEWNDQEEFPTMELEEGIMEVGIAFDDLKSGNNLSILLIHGDNEITLRYEGKLVYKEVANELESFVPNQSWENIIEKLYNKAKIIDKDRTKKENANIIQSANIKKKEILQKLQEKWGI